MRKLTEWSLRFRWLTLILAILLLGLGVYAGAALQQELLPNIE